MADIGNQSFLAAWDVVSARGHALHYGRKVRLALGGMGCHTSIQNILQTQGIHFYIKNTFAYYLTIDTHLDVTVVKALCGDSLSLAARSVVVSNGGGGRVAPHALRVASGDVVICLAGGGGRHKILGQDG